MNTPQKTSKPKLRRAIKFEHYYWFMVTYGRLEDKGIDPLNKFDEIAFAFQFKFNLPKARARRTTERYNKFWHNQ